MNSQANNKTTYSSPGRRKALLGLCVSVVALAAGTFGSQQAFAVAGIEKYGCSTSEKNYKVRRPQQGKRQTGPGKKHWTFEDRTRYGQSFEITVDASGRAKVEGSYVHDDGSKQDLSGMLGQKKRIREWTGERTETVDAIVFGTFIRAPRAGIDYRAGDPSVTVPSNAVVTEMILYLNLAREPFLRIMNADGLIKTLPCLSLEGLE